MRWLNLNIVIRSYVKKAFQFPKINFRYRYLQNEKSRNCNIERIEDNFNSPISQTVKTELCLNSTEESVLSVNRNVKREKIGRFLINNNKNMKLSEFRIGIDDDDSLKKKVKARKSMERHRKSDLKLNNNQEVIYGIFPVLLALQARRRTFYNLFLKDDFLNTASDKIREICDLCLSYNITPQYVNKNELTRMSGPDAVNQGVCLAATALPVIHIDNLHSNFMSQNLKGATMQLVLFLDRIHDPMNLGAILRTAYFFGVKHILTGAEERCPVSRIVSKASAGAAELLQVYEVQDSAKFLSNCQELGWQIIASVSPFAEDNCIDIDRLEISRDTILIIGNEGKGISPLLKALSDATVSIHPNSNCNKDMQTLNVSAASSILIYTIVSKARSSPG